jgi:hypothetical protein
MRSLGKAPSIFHELHFEMATLEPSIIPLLIIYDVRRPGDAGTVPVGMYAFKEKALNIQVFHQNN